MNTLIPSLFLRGSLVLVNLKILLIIPIGLSIAFLSDDGDKEVVGRTFNFNKLFFIKIILLGSFTILASRSAWLQLAKGSYYYSLAEGNRLRIEVIEPRRGIIYDRNLTPLVRNTANFVLYLRPIDLPKKDLERDELIRKLAQILDSPSTSNLESSTVENIVV